MWQNTMLSVSASVKSHVNDQHQNNRSSIVSTDEHNSLNIANSTTEFREIVQQSSLKHDVGAKLVAFENKN